MKVKHIVYKKQVIFMVLEDLDWTISSFCEVNESIKFHTLSDAKAWVDIITEEETKVNAVVYK